jgi:hypothetical protein
MDYAYFPPIIAVIRFKRSLLALDLQSRRFLLDRCLAYIGTDTDSADLRAWFEKCRMLSEYDTQNHLRKHELRSSEFWDELFAMYSNQRFGRILMYTNNLD